MIQAKKQISYVKRNFFWQFFWVSVLNMILCAAYIVFSRSTVGDEIIKLHQEILHQSVGETAAGVGEYKRGLIDITEDFDVIKWLEDGQNQSGENYVDNMIQNEVYANYKKGNRIRYYIYDLHGLRYSSEAAEAPNDLSAFGKEQEVGMDGIYLTDSVKSEEAGVYRYSFYMARGVRDFLSGEVLGYVILQISEKSIYDTFSDLRSPTSTYYLVGKNGKLISGENKNKIGKIVWETELVSDGNTMSGHTELPRYRQSDLYFYENVLGTDWYLIEQVDLREIWKSWNRTVYFALTMSTALILIFLLLTVRSSHKLLKPIEGIKHKMHEAAEGNLTVRIDEKEKGNGEFAEIADSFNYMAEKLEEQVQEIREMERKKHLLELDFLQAQINPHFIYNTLSSIRFYVEMGKNEEAEEMLIDFSKILRKTLSKSEKFVTLKEEIETITHYIRLQKARYRDRFEVEFQIEEKTKASLLPDFILQPIVENAIFYSLGEKEFAHIFICSYVKGQILYVSVKDDGIGMDETKINHVLKKGLDMNKVGLKNVNERLRLNYGDIYGVRIISEEGKGTEVILEMPFISERNRVG